MASVEEGFLTPEQREALNEASELNASSKDASTVNIWKSAEGTAKQHAPGGKHHVTLPAKQERKSHTGRNGRPKKGGSGGKGTWGNILDDVDEVTPDRYDPNYDSEEEPYKLVGAAMAQSVVQYKLKISSIIEEYFTSDDISAAAADLRDLGSPFYHHIFVKKLVSFSLDRHDKEKEMASSLLSALYSDVIAPKQLEKGFLKLLESVDDLTLDIPGAEDIIAMFLARAVVDDIVAPAFLTKAKLVLPEGSKSLEVLHAADTSLSTPHHAERVERCWGGSAAKTVEEVKGKIVTLLEEYVSSGDKAEAARCIRELNMPFFHHEIVKKALTMAIEKESAAARILELLKDSAGSGLITSSQMTKGFSRVADAVDDLSLDVPHAQEMFETYGSQAVKEGWLKSSFLKAFLAEAAPPVETKEARDFKQQCSEIIQEYFSSGDVREVARSLEELAPPHEFHPMFVKKVITMAMDRKSREKEMASVLLSALCSDVISSADIARAFMRLLEMVEDLALDIPEASNELTLFLARAVVDDILAPLFVKEAVEDLPEGSLGREVAQTVQAVLSARHAGERVLRCWGGGTALTVEEAKDRFGKLLEEYESGGDVGEACKCIRDVDMPFFHHELVKQALIMAIEKKNDHLLSLLAEGESEGLITTSQMVKGFGRVNDRLDDLALDNPNAKQKFEAFVVQAKSEGWLSSSYEIGKAYEDNKGCEQGVAATNGDNN